VSGGDVLKTLPPKISPFLQEGLLNTALANWPDHFHPFLQGILGTEPEQVRRGGGVSPLSAPRGY
jgi:hypothetical protein